MRQLSEGEMLSIREILQMETNGLSKVRVSQMAVTDPDLKAQVNASVLAAEGRVKALQQFISENEIIDSKEVY